MVNDWIEQGFLQIRLGILWSGYADRLDEADASGELLRARAERVRREVHGRFLAPAWLPGARDVIEKVRATVLRGRDPATVQTWLDGLARVWSKSWPGDLATADPADCCKAIHHYLIGCVKQAAAGKTTPGSASLGECAGPVLEPLGFTERLTAWIEQARALDVWQQELSERVDVRRSILPDLPWPEYQAECERVGKALATLPRRQKLSFLQRLFHDSRGRTALLDQTIDLLERCRNAYARLAEVARPAEAVPEPFAVWRTPIARVLDASSDAWPPKRLAQLQQELRRTDAGRFDRWLVDLQATGAADSWSGWKEELRSASPQESDSDLAHTALRRAVVESLGGELPAWFRLPPPPSFPPADGAAPLTAPPLLQWHEEARGLVWSPAEVAVRVQQSRQQFGHWLQLADGSAWFHRLAQQAARPNPASPARDWLTTLVAQGWCQCYPTVGATGEVAWPATEAARLPVVRHEFAEAVPGTVVAVERFATTADAARCTLSLGVRQPGSLLDAAHRLNEVVRATPWLGEALALTAEAMLAEAMLAEAMYPPSGAAASPEAAIVAVLDGLVQAIGQANHSTEAALNFRKLPAAQVPPLDAALDALRCWGRQHGFEILPRAWSFGRPLALPQLGADENGAALLFRADVPPRVVHRVRTFGLARGPVLVRPCALSASAGPPPAGFADLEELVRRPANGDEEKILQRLRGWREARLEGVFDHVAVQFFVDFWAEMGEGLRGREPDRAQALSERLTALLQQELRLEAFYPALYQDFPDGWLQLAQSRPITSGRILQVLRPGLRDEQGQLRVPALVNVE